MRHPVGTRVEFSGLDRDEAERAARLYHSLRGRNADGGLGITLFWQGCNCTSLFTVEKVDAVEDHLLRCEHCGSMAWACPSWFVVVDLPGCRCDVYRFGCSCGQMAKEQEAAGKRWNHWTKAWERAG